MANFADPTLKTLVETSPRDWLSLLHLPPARVSIIDADIAAVVSGAADQVLRVHTAPEYLLHLEFQTGHFSARVLGRLRLYNAVLDYRHDRRVRSVLVLLHPGADSPQLTGEMTLSLPGEPPYGRLRYDILRVWQVPVERLLTGGIGTLPLAPISAVSEAELPQVIERMQRRLRRAPERRLAQELWTATYLLLGVRYSRQVADVLLREVLTMIESDTYQAIVEKGELKGELKEARKLLLLQGCMHLGAPDPKTVAALQDLADLGRLEDMALRVHAVGSWEELLAPSRPRRKRAH